ncbi:MAG: hypothetical protein AB1689_02605 [Thermodesulfobacteriota bacterium]
MKRACFLARTALLAALLTCVVGPGAARAEDGASGAVESGMENAGNATKRGLSRAGEAVGEALDTAITKTGEGVGTVLEKTGEGFHRAGKAISGEPEPEVHEGDEVVAPPAHDEPIHEESLDE